MKEIYPVNLRTYSAKYIIFIVCFRPADFSYCWFRLWLLLQEPWRSLKKLEEAWRSFKTVAAADSSCSGWFKLRRLIQDLRQIDYLQNFDPSPPWYVTIPRLELLGTNILWELICNIYNGICDDVEVKDILCWND